MIVQITQKDLENLVQRRGAQFCLLAGERNDTARG